MHPFSVITPDNTSSDEASRQYNDSKNHEQCLENDDDGGISFDWTVWVVFPVRQFFPSCLLLRSLLSSFSFSCFSFLPFPIPTKLMSNGISVIRCHDMDTVLTK
jgi:hypothetical protein